MKEGGQPKLPGQDNGVGLRVMQQDGGPVAPVVGLPRLRFPTAVFTLVIERLGTTPITIRRDLAELATRGLLVRTHGGAVLPSVAKHPVALARKAATN